MSWMSVSLGRSPTCTVVSACDDIYVLPAPDHFEAFQPQVRAGGAFTGREIVFIAMPGADEVHFIAGKLLPDPAAIRADHVFDLVHHDAFASRSALVHAQVLVGVELALPVEDADFARAV